MFEYTGLPDSLPTTELEKRLQVNGYATIFKYQGKLYKIKTETFDFASGCIF